LFQKRILTLAILCLAAWALVDINKIVSVGVDTQHKESYLQSEKSLKNLIAFFEAFKEQYNKSKPSLKKNYKIFLKLNPQETDFSKDVNWLHYIDEQDMAAFEKELANLPEVNAKLLDLNMKVIRNKQIHYLLMNYAAAKVSTTSIGDYFSRYSIIIDLYSNLSIIDHDANYDYKTLVNGNEVFSYLDNQIKLPVSDSITFTTTYHSASRYLSKKNKEALSATIVYDLKDFLP